MTHLTEEARRWSARLTTELEHPVEVRFGRARRDVVVVRRGPRGTTVRLNEGFAQAPEEVRSALVQWMRSGRRARRASALLDGWIAELADRIGPPRRRALRVVARGETHDLSAIAAELLEAEFAGELPGDLVQRVTWGRRGTRRPRRSLQLGSYDLERDVVRVHPVLDQPAVPRFFVRYVVFHELLHAALDRVEEPPEPGRRRRHHSPAFRRREAAYSEYGRALAWQEKHLRALLRSARSGDPMPTTALGRALAAGQGLLFPDG